MEPPADELNVGSSDPDPKTRRDILLTENRVRAVIALASLALFAGTVLLGFVSTWFGNWENTKQLLDIVIPVETLIIGGAVGFYFGYQNKS